MEDCARMNRLYIETRYPSDEDLHLAGEAVERYHAAAQSLYDFICDLVYENVDIEDD